VKNFRLWLMTEVAACFFVALSPVQAETSESFEKTLDSLPESPTLTQMETAIAGVETEFTGVDGAESWLNPTQVAIADPVSQTVQGKLVPDSLIKELTALSTQSGLNFPEPSQTNVAQMMPSNRPAPPPPASGQQPMFPNPEIIIQQNGAPVQQSGGMNPTILNPRIPVAPLRPQAVPPPVGDLAISNINASFDMIDLGRGGQVIVPRLVLREAPAREVLAVLSRYAGMNLIFTDGEGKNESTGNTPSTTGAVSMAKSTITLDIENESVQDVFNYVLMASGLQASRRGNTIFAGATLQPLARNIVTRTIRLNQANALDAATFLSTQGASTYVYRENEEVETTLEGGGAGQSATGEADTQLTATREVKRTDPKIITLELEEEQKKLGILDGLSVSTDVRLNTVSLVGEPRVVEVATAMLTQLDARRRQVAVNVKIVDVNLNNIQDYDSSFSFGVGDSYFVQDSGAAVMRFGDTAPVTQDVLNSATGRISNPPAIPNPFSGSNTFIDLNNGTTIPGYGPGTFTVNPDGSTTFVPGSDVVFFNRTAGVSGNPFTTGITELTQATDNFITRTLDPATGLTTTTFTRGTLPTATSSLPSYFEYPQKFQAEIFAQIRSGNAKILTDPTLVVQEGQRAEVKLTQSVVSGVNSQVDPLSGVRTTTPVFSDVGLTLSVVVNKIDDNGFITMEVVPLVASPSGTQRFESGIGSVNDITLINTRALNSGQVRLRDSQTFILSGIISEVDQTTTSKVPILGDLPVIGALFRSSTDQTDRSEVIILVTPAIVHDNSEAQFGYRYNPDKETANYLRQKGFPVQAQP